MQLQDMENEVGLILQQPWVNVAGAPTWANFPGTPFAQNVVDFALNRGYMRLAVDLAPLELLTYTTTFLSTLGGYKYAIPPSGSPTIQQLQRVFYQPVGQPYMVEQVPGVKLIPWQEYQRYTSAGYSQTYATSTEPRVCALSPDRKSLYFYPGASAAGDTITIQYSPIPTGTTGVPILIGATDVPQLPDDTHEAIVYWALTILWQKAREMGQAQASMMMYMGELERIRENYRQSSMGGGLRFRSPGDLYVSPFGNLSWGE